MSHTVLVAEDDETTRFLIEEYCRNEPFSLSFATDGTEAMRLLNESGFDIVVTDVRLPGVSGEAILSYLQGTRPEVPVIVITGYGSIDGAVEFLQGGAFDYIAKARSTSVLISIDLGEYTVDDAVGNTTVLPSMVPMVWEP